MTEPPIDRDRIAELLEASAATILAEVVALGPEARWRPGPGEWSANECVGHLIEAERRGFAGRIRIILAADRPRLEDWDPAEVAVARHDEARDPAELLAELLPLRADGIELIRTLRDDELTRIGLHPEVGELTVGGLLGEWVHHDRNHVKQILSVVQAWVWPQMGNSRRFSDPNA